MVITCVAVGCQNRQGRDPGKSFHRFPTDPERRSRWIAALKREGWQPTTACRVCSDHFILSKSDDSLSLDYVPSQFQYMSSPQKKKSKVALNTFDRRSASRKRRRCVVSQSETDQSLLSMSASAPAEYCVEAADEQEGGPQIPDIAREISIQTGLSMSDI
ncbi:uncharacterized protein LOC143249712 isoform X2 [Tachypleus tridentatus]|uniref:uncharacterized protein LOC143249712 isoform X2 n=1 Tax=Tachypleus tridentatus TaxID=6853 RepID=UPI003FD5AF32